MAEQRALTTDDYLKAASIVATCRNERLPYVLHYLEQGGFARPNLAEASCGITEPAQAIRLIMDAKAQYGMSYTQIGKIVGLDRVQICRYANGQCGMKPQRATYIVHRLTDALSQMQENETNQTGESPVLTDGRFAFPMLKMKEGDCMAGQADGSIIIDTELSSDGFKAGSSELLAAIRTLSEEVKKLGVTLTELFKKPLTPEVNTGSAKAQIAALEAQVRELEAAMEEMRNAGSYEQTAAPEVSMGGTTQKASDIQRQIDTVNSSVERLAPTFQKAMSGSESAMTSFESRAFALESKIAELQTRLAAVGQTQFPTQEYETLCLELDKTSQRFDNLFARQEKMQTLGAGINTSQWKSLQYDMDLVSTKYRELLAKKQQMESTSSAFQMGADTSQYAQMESSLAAASARLSEMQSKTGQTGGLMSRLASAARSVGSHVASAAKNVAGKLASGIRSAVSSMAKMLTRSKSMNVQFGGLISGAKKFALSLLGARGVWALLRKAVSAYMSENQQLSNTLSSCWSGIGNLLGPIISKIINLVATAVSYVTSFLKLFGVVGKSTTKAISSAGGAAVKETDKLKRQLASFDELNILSDSKSGGGGGGGSGGADTSGSLPDMELPDWAKLFADQLKAGDWGAAAFTLTDQLLLRNFS